MRTMFLWKRIYDTITLLLFLIWIYGAGGGLSDKKWMMMKWLMDKHHDHHYESKGLSFSVKPIAIPIPLPMPLPIIAKKGDTKPEK